MSETNEQSTGKGCPTPPRKQQQQARKKPIVGDRSKEAKEAQKSKIREERQRARDGMMAGDERYLTLRDKGPQRRLARDVVDARFTAGELVLPLLFVVVLTTFIDSYELQLFSLFGMWGIFAVVGVDAYVVGRAAKKKIKQKFGEDKLESGIAWYAAMRSIQMRSLRIPKPQVKRFTRLEDL